jgi:hypothetical protein
MTGWSKVTVIVEMTDGSWRGFQMEVNAGTARFEEDDFPDRSKVRRVVGNVPGWGNWEEEIAPGGKWAEHFARCLAHPLPQGGKKPGRAS